MLEKGKQVLQVGMNDIIGTYHSPERALNHTAFGYLYARGWTYALENKDTDEVMYLFQDKPNSSLQVEGEADLEEAGYEVLDATLYYINERAKKVLMQRYPENGIATIGEISHKYSKGYRVGFSIQVSFESGERSEEYLTLEELVLGL